MVRIVSYDCNDTFARKRRIYQHADYENTIRRLGIVGNNISHSFAGFTPDKEIIETEYKQRNKTCSAEELENGPNNIYKPFG
jgi:20S proteasome alpha/beta subunit